ncbi:MAG: molybdopterin-binding protein [Bacillota bacterium]
MEIKLLKTEESVGRIICHDITRIEKGTFKGAAFKKGHCIREEDIPVLLDLGKNHIYALELDAGELHEDEAGQRVVTAVQGSGLEAKGPSEGRFNLVAAGRGLLKIDVTRLNRINEISDVIVSTLHSGVHVEKGESVAAVKVVPLVVPDALVRRVEVVCAGEKIISILPYHNHRIGLVITGREVAEGRIKDGFAPVLFEKCRFYGLAEPAVRYAVDDAALIAGEINALLNDGCTFVIVTGGMSVDPDDVTPAAIRQTGAVLVKYGAPVLPGAMFLLAYKDDIPVIGLPACAMYYRTTVLDVIMPRLLAGEKVTAADIGNLGHGGLCRACEICRFPHCSFGKGGF